MKTIPVDNIVYTGRRGLCYPIRERSYTSRLVVSHPFDATGTVNDWLVDSCLLAHVGHIVAQYRETVVLRPLSLEIDMWRENVAE